MPCVFIFEPVSTVPEVTALFTTLNLVWSSIGVAAMHHNALRRQVCENALQWSGQNLYREGTTRVIPSDCD